MVDVRHLYLSTGGITSGFAGRQTQLSPLARRCNFCNAGDPASRTGHAAAKNLLGRREKFDAVPFFWSQHYDVAINYVGHAENWDAVEIDGSLEARDCAVTYKTGGRALAVATISRDLQSLRAEASMEAELPSQRQHVA